MNVLLLTHQFFPRHVGGTEVYTLRMAQALQQAGHHPLVVTYHESPSGNPADFKTLEGEHQGVPYLELGYNLSVAPRPARFEYANTAIAGRVRSLLAERPVDLVHATHLMKVSGAALLPALEAGLPCVITLTDFWAICGRHTLLRSSGALCSGPRHALDCVRCLRDTHGFADRRVWEARLSAGARAPLLFGARQVGGDLLAIAGRNPYLRRVLRRADRLVCLSEFQKEILIRNGLPAGRMELVPHGLEADLRLPDGPAPPPEGDLVFVGSLAPHKGLHTVVEALERRPDLELRLDVYGDVRAGDAYAADLVARTRHDRRVTWRGTFPPAELATVIRRYRAVVVPAQWYENSPLVAQLAVILGLPVLASRLGTLAEMLAGRSGHQLLAPDSPAAWSEAFAELAAGRWPRPSPAHDLWTWEAHVERMLAIYREVLP